MINDEKIIHKMGRRAAEKERQESGEAARKGNGIRPSRAASPLSCRGGKMFYYVFSSFFLSVF